MSHPYKIVNNNNNRKVDIEQEQLQVQQEQQQQQKQQHVEQSIASVPTIPVQVPVQVPVPVPVPAPILVQERRPLVSSVVVLLRVVLIASGTAIDSNRFRPKQYNSQWWNRHDALVRCTSSFLFSTSTSTSTSINSSSNSNGSTTCTDSTTRSTDTTTNTCTTTGTSTSTSGSSNSNYRELIILFDTDWSQIYMSTTVPSPSLAITTITINNSNSNNSCIVLDNNNNYQYRNNNSSSQLLVEKIRTTTCTPTNTIIPNEETILLLWKISSKCPNQLFYKNGLYCKVIINTTLSLSLSITSTSTASYSCTNSTNNNNTSNNNAKTTTTSTSTNSSGSSSSSSSGSSSSSNNNNTNTNTTVTTTNKRTIAQLIHTNCSIEFLRHHKINTSIPNLLKKYNISKLLNYWNLWLKEQQQQQQQVQHHDSVISTSSSSSFSQYEAHKTNNGLSNTNEQDIQYNQILYQTFQNLLSLPATTTTTTTTKGTTNNNDFSNNINNNSNSVIAVLLHESSDNELVFNDNTLTSLSSTDIISPALSASAKDAIDTNTTTPSTSIIVVFLGAVRDMTNNENTILYQVCNNNNNNTHGSLLTTKTDETNAICMRTTIPLVHVRFGPVAEFTSKILSILSYHYTNQQLLPALVRQQQQQQSRMKSGHNPTTTASTTASKPTTTDTCHTNNANVLANNNSTYSRKRKNNEISSSLSLSSYVSTKLHYICFVDLDSNLVQSQDSDTSNTTTATVDGRQQQQRTTTGSMNNIINYILWCMVRIVVTTLWRSKVASTSLVKETVSKVSSSSSSEENTQSTTFFGSSSNIHCTNQLTFIFLDNYDEEGLPSDNKDEEDENDIIHNVHTNRDCGNNKINSKKYSASSLFAITLEQDDIVQTMAQQHHAAPTEYQIRQLLQEKILQQKTKQQQQNDKKHNVCQQRRENNTTVTPITVKDIVSNMLSSQPSSLSSSLLCDAVTASQKKQPHPSQHRLCVWDFSYPNKNNNEDVNDDDTNKLVDFMSYFYANHTHYTTNTSDAIMTTNNTCDGSESNIPTYHNQQTGSGDTKRTCQVEQQQQQQQNHSIIFLSISQDRYSLLNASVSLSSSSTTNMFDTFVHKTKRKIVKVMNKYSHRHNWIDKTKKIECFTAGVAKRTTTSNDATIQDKQKNGSIGVLTNQQHHWVTMEQQYGLDWQALTITMLQHGTYLDPNFWFINNINNNIMDKKDQSKNKQKKLSK